MKALRKRLIIILIIAVALFISNPDLHKHQGKIIGKFKRENPLSGKLGGGKLIKEIVAYDNYYVCSVGKISVTDEPVSFGIAGFVVVFASLDLLKYKEMIKDEM